MAMYDLSEMITNGGWVDLYGDNGGDRIALVSMKSFLVYKSTIWLLGVKQSASRFG